MKLGKSEWEQHCEAMQDDNAPYLKELWSAIGKHQQKLPTDRYGNRTTFSEQAAHFETCFETIDDLIKHLEDKERSTNRDEGKYYRPLSLFGIRTSKTSEESKPTPDYIILLNPTNRYWILEDNPSYFLHRLIAESIWERGLHSNDPLNKEKEYIWTGESRLYRIQGYLAASLSLHKRTEELDGKEAARGKREPDHDLHAKFWGRSCYSINLDLVDRFARDVGQYQRIINCEQYKDEWKGFEKQFGEAMRCLARAFAVTDDPEAMIKGIAGTVLLGRMFHG